MCNIVNGMPMPAAIACFAALVGGRNKQHVVALTKSKVRTSALVSVSHAFLVCCSRFRAPCGRALVWFGVVWPMLQTGCMLLRVLMKKGHTAQQQMAQMQQAAPGAPLPPQVVQAVKTWRQVYDGYMQLLQGKLASLVE